MIPDDGIGKPRRLTAWQAAKAVFWGFFGVRRGKDYESDAANLTAGQVIAAGLIAALLFVILLVVLVSAIVP